MLGVFLLPAFTNLGHECQDVLSLCDGFVAADLLLRSQLYLWGSPFGVIFLHM